MGKKARGMEAIKAYLGHKMTFRISARLETKGKNVIKGINLEGLRVVGEVRELALNYFLDGADELIVNDVTSSWFSIESTVALLSDLLSSCFIPITIGGGIRSLQNADSCLRAGAERVSINSGVFSSPNLITEIAFKYGRQATVLNIQAKRIKDEFYCYYENGREFSGITISELLRQSFMDSVGEIFLNSIDFDGTNKGVDSKLLEKVMELTEIPVTYCGGVSSPDHIVTVLTTGADGVALGSALHYGILTIPIIKKHEDLMRLGIRPIEK